MPTSLFPPPTTGTTTRARLLPSTRSTPTRRGASDPHFWLDPVRFAQVATAIGERFATVDPANAADYRAAAAALVKDLDALDDEFESGLAQCRSHELVTGHAAFAYLADRYGLRQEGIAGRRPRRRA